VELAEGKLKRVMELANKLGARFALIVGDDEMAPAATRSRICPRASRKPDPRRNRRQAGRGLELIISIWKPQLHWIF
jgi:histidyl-tRNA synthetase